MTKNPERLDRDIQDELLLLYKRKEQLLQQEVYKRDLYKLCWLIGFRDLGSFHKDLCKTLEETEGYKRRIFLLPRSFFKTSVISIANVVRDIIRNPEIRILIASSTLENVKKIIRIIKGVFWENREFREIFPEFCPPENIKEFGTQLGFVVPNRESKVLKEDTIEGAGDGQTIVGRHYDKIMVTDIVTTENSASKLQLMKTKEWVRFLPPLLHHAEESTIDMEGTRYNYEDVHGEWEKMARDEPTKFFLYKRPALYANENGVEKSLFHEKYSVDQIRMLAKEQGSAIFAGQYLLDPIDTEHAMFKRQQIRYLSFQQMPRRVIYDQQNNKKNVSYPYYTAIDPAISESTDADYSVITTGFYNEEADLFIVDIRFGHWGTKRLIEQILWTYEKWKSLGVGIESVAFQKMLSNVLKEINAKAGGSLPIREIGRDTHESKKMRISSLQWRFEQGKIFFADHLDKEFIEEQILRYDANKKNNKDDLLDTLVDIEQIKMVPEKDEEDQYIKYPMKAWVEYLESYKNDGEEDDFPRFREEEEHEYYASDRDGPYTN